MPTDAALQEVISFRRRTDLPGVEVRDVQGSSRRWRCFGTGFEFLAPRTWHGDILYRRRQAAVEPGAVFCSHPGEVYTTPRVHKGGSGSALILEPDVLSDYLAEHELVLSRLDVRSVVQMSHVLSERLHTVFDLLRPGTHSMELESSVVELVAVLVTEVFEQPHSRVTKHTPADSVVERIRECLHFDHQRPLDLNHLSAQTGLSRFQVLRSFKRKYGLPPYAYQMRVRIGLAQRALRDGTTPAAAAADFGFVDQSHFSRHFKALVGVTPAQYVRPRH